jgi:prepilin signal peptidase PulO-like enzyme (type II secretory pathway)
MDALFSTYFFIFGTLVGSFLNVVILRLPLQKDLVVTRSACPVCGTQLKWYHNIPILSFAFLKGKCGFCGTRISWRYPLVEIFTGLVAFWLMPNAFDLQSVGFFAFYFSIAAVFICHFLIDIDHQLLLDSLNIYLVAIILPFSLVMHQWQYWVFGGVIGFGFPLLVTWLFYKLRGQVGLGGGDIKLFGILGLLLGPTGIIFTIFMSCFIGAIIGLTLLATKQITKDRPIPFGPAIILVASVQIFFPSVFSLLQAFLM